jgi:hypothetical protein
MTTATGPTSTSQPIDREKVCPLLLRVFCSTSRHNNLAEYNRGKDWFSTGKHKLRPAGHIWPKETLNVTRKAQNFV